MVNAQMPLGTKLGIRTFGDAEEIDATLEWAPELCTAGGVLHGGVLMTLADAAGAVCAFLNLPEGARTVTIESKTNFLGAVREGEVRARARPLHVGKRRSSSRRTFSTRRDAASHARLRHRPSSTTERPVGSGVRPVGSDPARMWPTARTGLTPRVRPSAGLSCPGRGGGSSVGRAPGCGPGGRGFESRPPPLMIAMTNTRVSRLHRGLIAVLVTTYVAAAIVGISADFVSNKLLWAVVLGGSAALIVIGAFVKNLPSWLSLGLISVGAIAGGVLLIPLVLPPIAAALLVMLTYSLSRRPSAA